MDAVQALAAQCEFVGQYGQEVAQRGGITDSDLDFMGTAFDLGNALLSWLYEGEALPDNLVAALSTDCAPQPVLDFVAALPVRATT